MKIIPAFMVLTLLMLPGSARAEVTAVTLYPTGGEITERFEANASRISAGSYFEKILEVKIQCKQ